MDSHDALAEPLDWQHSLTFRAMDLATARHIAVDWKYPAPYDFYDATADPEDYVAFITPSQWPEHFWQVRAGEDLVGFLTAEPLDDDACEVSLGLRPDLTGHGRGSDFLAAGLRQVTSALSPLRVVLDVAAFNQRAVKVYRAAGFTVVDSHPQQTNGGVHEFLRMERRTD